VRKALFVMVVLSMAFLLTGCPGDKPSVEPEISSTDAEDLEARAEPEVTEDTGLQTEQTEPEELPQLDLQRIHFDTDKWNIREDARDILKANAEVLKANPGVKIVVEGHCDERNTVEYNLALGERRAVAAKDYLVRLGVDGAQVNTISYGEERPAAFGHDESSWWQNRRAEFIVTR